MHFQNFLFFEFCFSSWSLVPPVFKTDLFFSRRTLRTSVKRCYVGLFFEDIYFKFSNNKDVLPVDYFWYYFFVLFFEGKVLTTLDGFWDKWVAFCLQVISVGRALSFRQTSRCTSSHLVTLVSSESTHEEGTL